MRNNRHELLQLHTPFKYTKCIVWLCIPTAPSTPPTSVGVSEVTSFSITVQWEPVDCIHRNGDITDYTVRYRVVLGGESGIIRDVTVLGVTQYTILNLMPSTIYTIMVAVGNDAGRKFSGAMMAMTDGI